MKELYPPGVPENVASRNRVLLSKLQKKDNFYGDQLILPIVHGNPAGRSAVFATAQSNASTSTLKKFALTRAADYGVVLIDAEAIYASQKDVGAFLEAKKNEVDGILDQLGHSLSISLYGSGSGSIGRRGSISSTTITLTSAADAKNFQIGMVLVANDTDNATSVRSGTMVVTGVNEDDGKITVDADDISGFVDNDYLFVEGDPGAKLTGLAGWIPLSAPSATTFFGVDRSVDTTRLGGVRVDNTSASIEENILTVAEKCVQYGGKPDACFINHTNFSNLVKGLGSKVQYTDTGGKVGVGWRGVMLHTSSGTVEVFPDPDCPSNRGYVLTMDSWCIYHLEGLPHIVTDDGKSSMRRSSADGIEVRVRYWAQLGCKAPAWNGVFSI